MGISGWAQENDDHDGLPACCSILGTEAHTEIPSPINCISSMRTQAFKHPSFGDESLDTNVQDWLLTSTIVISLKQCELLDRRLRADQRKCPCQDTWQFGDLGDRQAAARLNLACSVPGRGFRKGRYVRVHKYTLRITVFWSSTTTSIPRNIVLCSKLGIPLFKL